MGSERPPLNARDPTLLQQYRGLRKGEKDSPPVVLIHKAEEGCAFRLNGKVFSTRPSVVQHIGKIGENSDGNHYDFAEDFAG